MGMITPIVMLKLTQLKVIGKLGKETSELGETMMLGCVKLEFFIQEME